MPYFERLDHLQPPTQASFGPSSSLWENIGAAWDHQTRVDAQYALEAEFSKLYAENLARASELSGQQFENPLGEGMGSWEFAQNVLDLRLGNTPEGARRVMQSYPWVTQFDQNEQALAELALQFPEIKTFEQLIEDVKEIREQVMETAESAAARGGLPGAFGQFVGGTAGSFSFRDPALIGSIAIPGAGPGASLFRKMVVDGLISAGVEGAIQFGSIQPTREMLGEAPTNPWVSIAFAGAGGAAFRGALEGVPAGYRALERRIAPDRVRAREFARALDQSQVRPSTAQLLDMARTADLNPTARAARHALEGEQALVDANPYGNTPAGIALARQEFEKFLREFEGMPAPARTQTAVGRFLPEHDSPLNAPDTPQAMMARLREPELYDQIDAIESRIGETQLRVEELTSFIEERRVSDAVSLIDQPSGARLREIETELDNPATPRARREALEREADMIVESIGPERIAKAANDSAIKPRHQLREARRAQRRDRQAQSRLLNRARELEEGLRFPEQTPNKETPDLGTEAADVNTRLEAEAPTMLDRAREMVEAARVADDDGMVSVGGVRVPEDFRFDIDEAGNSISVRQMLDDLAEDDAMLDAMRVCSL